MSNSMRILTYNTQMRSALMEMGFPPSIPPVYNAPLRAKLVSQAILDSAEEIDRNCSPVRSFEDCGVERCGGS